MASKNSITGDEIKSRSLSPKGRSNWDDIFNKKNPTPLAEELLDGILLMDGYNDCLIGTVEQFGRDTIACYDKDKLIERHIEDGMDEDEAEEFFQYNQLGAYVGDRTPCFITIGCCF